MVAADPARASSGWSRRIFRPIGRMWRSHERARDATGSRTSRAWPATRWSRSRSPGRSSSTPASARPGEGRDLPGAHDGAARGRRARCSCRCSTARGRGARSRSWRRSAARSSACYAAPRFDTLLLFPCRVPAAGALEGARDHEERTRDGVRGPERGARPRQRAARADRRRRRACSPAGPGAAAARARRTRRPSCTAAAAVYGVAAVLNLRLPQSARARRARRRSSRTGSIAALTAPAIGAAGLRAATGFLLFALAFALARGAASRRGGSGCSRRRGRRAGSSAT